MMSAPGLTPVWGATPSVSDPIASTLQDNLRHVSDVAALTLQEALADSQRIFNDPNATTEQLRNAGLRVMQLSAAATAATNSIEAFDAGQKAEQQMSLALSSVTTADIEGLPDKNAVQGSKKTPADIFSEQAAEYYERSTQQMSQSAVLVGADEGFDRSLAKVGAAEQTPTQRRVAFWNIVANAVLDLQLLGQRARSFPQHVVAVLRSSVDNGQAAVQEAWAAWGNRATREYSALQKGVAQVVERSVGAAQEGKDTVYAAGSAVVGRLLAVNAATDRFVEHKIVGPVFDFVFKTAVPKMAQWSAAAYEAVQQQTQNMQHDFSAAMLERRAARAAVAKAPEPTTPAP